MSHEGLRGEFSLFGLSTLSRSMARCPAKHVPQSEGHQELTKGRNEMTSRTILTVGALTGAALACSAMAQTYTPIYSTGFNTSQGFVAGSVNGQNGWTTFGTGTSDIVLNAPAGAEGDGALKLTASNANSYSWPAPFGTAWSTGNFYELRVSQKIYVPSGQTATARPGSIVWDSTGTKILSGYYVQVDTGNLYLLVNNTVNGTNANYAYGPVGVVTKDTWIDVVYKFNAQSGRAEVVFGTTGGYVNSVSTPGSAADEVDYYLRAFGTATAVGGYMFSDSLAVDGLGTAYPACVTATNACDAVSATGGCNLVGCCDTICQTLPSCCDTAWDSSCVGLAVPTCGLFVYSCTNPGTPVNNCATSPTVLSSLPVTLAYDTTAATTDGPPEAGCNSGESDLPIHKDVWYRFLAPTSGTLIASNCNGGGFGGSGDFDSKIALYDLGTDLAAFDAQLLPDYFVSCNEDCTNEDPANLKFTSTLSQSITAGHYYLVRLGGYLGASGVGNIYIGLVPPPNPCDPANIINGVAGINTVTGDAQYAGFTATQCAFPLGTQVISKAKFIKFTPAASGLITFQSCSDAGGAATDSRLAAMTVCGDATTIIGCDDDGCVPGSTTVYTSKLQFNCTANTTYYVAVGGYDAGWTGSNVEIIPPTAPACPADLNNDGQVNGADLGLLLGAWGPCSGCAADLNADGQVNGADLGLLLGAWGACP